MSDIFISYARHDRVAAERVAHALGKYGWSVWWDRNIPPGKSFDQVIQEQLEAARCMIVLWSHTSVASDWIRSEAEEGMTRKILVPALIEEVRIPIPFRRIQAANLVAWTGDNDAEGFLALTSAVQDLLQRSSGGYGRATESADNNVGWSETQEGLSRRPETQPGSDALRPVPDAQRGPRGQPKRAQLAGVSTEPETSTNGRLEGDGAGHPKEGAAPPAGVGPPTGRHNYGPWVIAAVVAVGGVLMLSKLQSPAPPATPAPSSGGTLTQPAVVVSLTSTPTSAPPSATPTPFLSLTPTRAPVSVTPSPPPVTVEPSPSAPATAPAVE